MSEPSETREPQKYKLNNERMEAFEECGQGNTSFHKQKDYKIEHEKVISTPWLSLPWILNPEMSRDGYLRRSRYVDPARTLRALSSLSNSASIISDALDNCTSLVGVFQCPRAFNRYGYWETYQTDLSGQELLEPILFIRQTSAISYCDFGGTGKYEIRTADALGVETTVGSIRASTSSLGCSESPTHLIAFDNNLHTIGRVEIQERVNGRVVVDIFDWLKNPLYMLAKTKSGSELTNIFTGEVHASPDLQVRSEPLYYLTFPPKCSSTEKLLLMLGLYLAVLNY